MANIKDLIQSIEAPDSSFDEKLAAITQIEETLVAMQQQEEKAINDNVDLIVEAINVMQKKVDAQLVEIKGIIPEKGDKGDKGDKGIDGKNGRDGKDGVSGKDGKDGVSGSDGVSVTDAKIDFDGSLIITLSSGRELNVGEVVAPDLAEKIKVINTMSTNGAVVVKDEGTSISSGVKSINFVGAAVTVTNSGDDVTVNVSAGTGTVTSVTGTSPVASSGGTTPAISLASGYGDTLNPYASKTANYFLSAPNGTSGVPTFRAVASADIPTLNQNTTGSAGSVATTSFSIVESGGKLLFKYGATTIASMSSTGIITSATNIVANGTP